jgi:hypothetical protein
LADLFTLLFAANPFSAARASLWRWSSDEFEDGLAHGGQCRSRRRPVDSFFPADMAPRSWELIGLSLLAGLGFGLALDRGDLIFVAVFGAACGMALIGGMQRFP